MKLTVKVKVQTFIEKEIEVKDFNPNHINFLSLFEELDLSMEDRGQALIDFGEDTIVRIDGEHGQNYFYQE